MYITEGSHISEINLCTAHKTGITFSAWNRHLSRIASAVRVAMRFSWKWFMAVDPNSNSWQGYGRNLVSWLLHQEGWSNFWRRLCWMNWCEKVFCKHWRCEVENVWNMYSVQIFLEELCCLSLLLLHLAELLSAWCVNSMAVFAYKSTLWVWYSNCARIL